MVVVSGGVLEACSDTGVTLVSDWACKNIDFINNSASIIMRPDRLPLIWWCERHCKLCSAVQRARWPRARLLSVNGRWLPAINIYYAVLQRRLFFKKSKRGFKLQENCNVVMKTLWHFDCHCTAVLHMQLWLIWQRPLNCCERMWHFVFSSRLRRSLV